MYEQKENGFDQLIESIGGYNHRTIGMIFAAGITTGTVGGAIFGFLFLILLVFIAVLVAVIVLIARVRRRDTASGEATQQPVQPVRNPTPPAARPTHVPALERRILTIVNSGNENLSASALAEEFQVSTDFVRETVQNMADRGLFNLEE